MKNILDRFGIAYALEVRRLKDLEAAESFTPIRPRSTRIGHFLYVDPGASFDDETEDEADEYAQKALALRKIRGSYLLRQILR